LLPVALG
ncbi:hypothetical protein MKD33_03030, partial [Chromobacterium piscinae]